MVLFIIILILAAVGVLISEPGHTAHHNGGRFEPRWYLADPELATSMFLGSICVLVLGLPLFFILS